MPALLIRSVVAVAISLSLGLSSSAAAAAEDRALIRPEEGQVVRLYAAVLDRSPDPGGFAFWFRRLTTTESLEQVTAHFIASPEFARIAGAPTDSQFVDLMYANVLNRLPDAGGRAFWLEQLRNGMPRVRVVLHFSESPEFTKLTGTTLPKLGPFTSSIDSVTAQELGSSWRTGCPVAPQNLRRLTIRHVDFNGEATTGEVIVHADVADQMVEIFRQLYAVRYPVERMEPVDRYGSDDITSMEANNTSAFNCRAVTGGAGWSYHAYGLAIDINPLLNPYVNGQQVLPESGRPWVDRTQHHPALIHPDDPVVDAFKAAGWRWGGDFNSIDDWQHFDLPR